MLKIFWLRRIWQRLNSQAIGELRGSKKSEEKAHAELVAEAQAIRLS